MAKASAAAAAERGTAGVARRVPEEPKSPIIAAVVTVAAESRTKCANSGGSDAHVMDVSTLLNENANT